MGQMPMVGKGQTSSDCHCRCHEAKTPVHGYLHSMVEIGMMKVLIDHQIFDAIPDSGISIPELADKTGAELNILERFSNFLIAARVLSSPSQGRISHTEVSRTFRDPRAKLFFSHMFDFFLIPAMEWSEYFDINGLAEPKHPSRTPFGLAAGHPDKSFYELLDTMPERASSLNNVMAAVFGCISVVGVYDFSWVGEHAAQAQNGNTDSSRPLIVDVGGGEGHALRSILKENLTIPAARCVLQDRAEIVREAREEGGVLGPVRKIAVDFLEEQPTKGALVYYLRRILSDWPDEGCVRILRKIRNACAEDSRVIVAEHLLSDQPSLDFATGDICMMNFGGKWRTERMFRDLASKSGLKVTSVCKDKSSDSVVIEMVPA